MKKYIPKFRLTEMILNLDGRISKLLQSLVNMPKIKLSLSLRKASKIETITSTFAIQGSSLSYEQITDVINGKRIVGPEEEILAIKNAILAYDNISNLNALSIKDLLKTHGIMLKDLIFDCGNFRTYNVRVRSNLDQTIHLPPEANKVEQMVEDLFDFISKNMNISWTVKSCIFHYEFEFIHPFGDGNGRMGRLWQQLILTNLDNIFEAICIETIVKENQKRYYEAFRLSNLAGEGTAFVEFSLMTILEALEEHFKKMEKISKNK